MDPPGPIPEKLAPLRMYLDLAKNIEKESPSAAFFVRMRASEIGVKILQGASEDENAQKWLLSLIKNLEDAKRDNDYMKDMFEEEVALEKRAWGVLETAQAREGKVKEFNSNEELLNQAKKYQTALILFETLSIFGKPRETVRKSIIHCKLNYRDLLRKIKTNVNHNNTQLPTGSQPTTSLSPQPTASLSLSESIIDIDASIARNQVMKQAEREAKHAISAIQFDDVETAKLHLKNSLQTLKSLDK